MQNLMSDQLVQNGRPKILQNLECGPDNPYRWLKYPLLIVGLFLFMSLVLVNCGNDSEGTENPGNPRAGADRSNPQNVAAIPVQVVAAKKDDISLYLMQTTTIEAERVVEILAKVSGEVVKLPAEEGNRVKKGDLLAQLNEAELKINFIRAKASLETDQSVYNRSKDMLERNFIAKEDYEAARLQYESSKAAYEEASLQLEYTSIRAPFDGVVTVRNIELGQRVNQNQSLFILGDFSPLRAKIYVPEKDISRIYTGMSAKIEIEAEPEEEFTGVVKMISPIVDPESGTSKVTIDIDDDRGKLKPGMFASVFITTETHTNTLVIPKRSLVLESDLDQVYIFQNGVAKKVTLKLGFTSGDFVEVLNGLQEGDLVVTAGQDGLREGLPLRIPGVETATTGDSSAATGKAPPTQSVDLDRLKQMEARLLNNPEIKKEYENRVKADPDLKNNPEKKLAFFREMRQKMRRSE